MSRPVIGISTAAESAAPYVTAVQDAGAMALVLPADDAIAEEPAQLLDLLDGLLLGAGVDVDPGSYGAREDPSTGPTSPERDRFELGLAWAALERDLPVLGVGRGMQLLNVACGGTLHQHLEGHAAGGHGVRVAPGSLAARAVAAERLVVESGHHQGVAELGEGLVAVAWSGDEQVEAVELPERGYALGVLWEPGEGPTVIGSLVEAARQASAKA